MAQQENLVGIDLGTTLSVIAHIDAMGNATTISNSDGEPLTPSAIYLDGNHAVVGKTAKQTGEHVPEKVATYVKREMGRKWYSRLIDGREFRPATLAAIILRKLKLDAERKIGPISRAIVTVPAYFDDARRRATEDAGRIAGFESVTVFNEPTAAALAYCFEGYMKTQRQISAAAIPENGLTVLVYDLGGGTFDVTVLHMRDRNVYTLATDGAVKLGGKDWDDRIVSYVRREFKRLHNVEISPEESNQAIANQAEVIKHLLSRLPAAELQVYYKGRDVRITLTREKFQEMTRDLVAQTEVVTNLVVKKQTKFPGTDQPLDWANIDRVLLVGGSTRMPIVAEMLERISGKSPDKSLDPDQIVAKGASIYAGILAARGEAGDLLLTDEIKDEISGIGITDVNSHSLGIEVYSVKEQKIVNAILISKNHPLPCATSRVFPTGKPGPTLVRVKVMEGEAPDPTANIQLGECVIHLTSALPERSPVQVRLNYEKNGRLGVMALDMTGGTFAQVEIQGGSGMTEEEVREERDFVYRLKID